MASTSTPTDRAHRDGPSRWVLFGLPPLLAALLHLNTLGSGFVYDDPLILEWLETRRWDLEGFLRSTRGITYAFHALDKAIWGENPFGFHLTNVALHTLATWLVVRCASSLGASPVAAFVAGLLFAVHPVHVEVVANVANRKDMVAWIFLSLALLAWIHVRGRAARVALTTLGYGLAIYSKEVAAAGLVAMLVLWDVWLSPSAERPVRRLRTSLFTLAPLLGLGLAAATIFARDLAAFFEPESIRKMSDGHYADYATSLATSLGNIVDFARLLLWPHPLAIDYPIQPQESLLSGRVLAGGALLIAAFALVVRTARARPLVAFSVAWIPVMLAPCSNWIPLHHIHVAERYLYVPSFGLVLALGIGFDALRTKSTPPIRTAAFAAIGMLLAAGALRTVSRNSDWKDVESIVRAIDRDGIDTWRAHKTAGAHALQRGDDQEAARRYSRAAELRPGDPVLQYWRAVACLEVGDVVGSLQAGRAAVELAPDNPRAQYNLGLALIQSQRLSEAIEHLSAAVRIEPLLSAAHYNLGVAWSLEGDASAAQTAFENCVLAEPAYSEAHYNLGLLQSAKGQHRDAFESFRTAVLLEPENVRYLERIAETCIEMREPAWALEAYERAAELLPMNPEIWERLGDLAALAGDGPRAVQGYQRAIEIQAPRVELLIKAGEACEREANYEWAARAYQSALEMRPEDAQLELALERVREQQTR